VLEHKSIRLESAIAVVEGDEYVIMVRVTNMVPRTLYAYGSVRRASYDNDTRKLLLQLHDHGYTPEEEEVIASHMKQPRIVPLEGGTQTELKITLAPMMRRIRPANERGTGPLFEELHISEATVLELEVAHQDTPFYYNPKQNNLHQLQEWGTAIATAMFDLGRGAARH
jgi:hypothetical protein